MKVLIADDDLELIRYIQTLLETKGCEVVTAQDAVQTMNFSVRHKPDVILLDVEMPGGTGRNALKNLKKTEDTSRIPVLVYSGSSDPFLHDEMINLGADGFIEKPLNPDTLHDILCWLCGSSGDQKVRQSG